MHECRPCKCRIDAESFAHDSLALLNRLGSQRPHAPLAIERALAFGDDDFRARNSYSTPRAALERPAHVVGVSPLHPPDSNPFYGVDDRVVSLRCTLAARKTECPGRRSPPSSRCR